MSEQTSIQWCGATWNPWQGCIKISPGCKNCYMYRDKERYGQDPRDVHRSSPATFNAPLRWQREVEQGRRRGQGRLVFTCSWSDWFIAEADAWRDEAWDIIRRCPDLIFQILTKRPERIPYLLEVPARVRFLSCEPLLSEIDLAPYLWPDVERYEGRPIIRHALDCEGECEGRCHNFVPDQPSESDGIHWVIIGGESGYATGKYAARPCHVNWIRSIVRQCRTAGVPCYVKQLGSWPRWDRDESERYLRDKHGGDIEEFPEDLRVREFPVALENA